MAYQFFGPSPPQISLSAIPGETTLSVAEPSYTTNVPSASRLPGVKEEFLGSTASYLQQEDVNLSRPVKKQKLTEGQSHRFVSQKKWKFSDAQPWLPSKVSSKAQNASKASSKTKKEPASPRISAQLSVCPGVTSTNVATTPTKICGNQDSISDELLQPARSGIDASSRSDKVVTSSPPSLPNSRPNPTPNTNTTSISVVPSPAPKVNLSVPEKSIQFNLPAKPQPSPIVDTTPNSASHALAGKSKSSRSITALSLEKDAERIAALIAEKRKENESSMFRERMLQRQLEHKNHKDPHSASQEGLPTQSTSPSDPPPEAEHRPESPSHDSVLTSTDSVVSSQPCVPSRQATDYSQTQDDQITWNPSVASQNSVNVSKGHVKTGNPPVGTTSSGTPISELRCSPNHSEHEILFGGQPSSRVFANEMHHGSRNFYGNPSAPIRSPNSIAASESGSGQLGNQRMPPRNQNAPTPLRAIPAQDTVCVRQMRPQYYSGQASSPLPNQQPGLLRRTSSTTSSHRQPSVEASIGSIPSPLSVSSQSPTSMSIRHFSQIDISTQPQTYPADYSSTPDRSRTTSAGQMSMNAAAYYAMNRQMWTSSEQHFDPSTMSNQAIHTAPLVRSNAVSAAHNPGTIRQQQYPQPPVLASNTNMFSGNSKSSAVIGPESTHAKPRVNMFSNTRGVAFPMQEVIRQIEMT